MTETRKAAILTWDGFQDQEVIYPYYRLQEAGFDVDIYANKNPVEGLFKTKFVSRLISEIFQMEFGLSDYSMLVLTGGVKALEKIRQDSVALSEIRNWPDNKVIASICHGAQLLISAKKVKGKSISGYYSIKDDIENAGGTYHYNPIVSKNISSAAHYADMPEWMRNTLELYDELSKRSNS